MSKRKSFPHISTVEHKNMHLRSTWRQRDFDRGARTACVALRFDEIRQKSQKVVHKYNKLENEVTRYTTACGKCFMFTTYLNHCH